MIAILRDFSPKTAMQWYTAGSATSIHCTRDSSSSLGTRRRLYRTTNTTQQRRYPARNDAMTSLAAAVSTCLHVTLACKYDAIHKPEMHNVSHWVMVNSRLSLSLSSNNACNSTMSITVFYSHVVPEIHMRTDRQTDTHTDTLIAILRSAAGNGAAE